MIIHQNNILGLVLAGGQSRRMASTISDAPKWQLTLGDEPIISHVLKRLKSQVHSIVINGSHNDLSNYSYPVIRDTMPENQGPLAGLLTGLEYAQQQGINWVASCPCDSPFFPLDYVQALSSALTEEQHRCASIQHQSKIHGVFGLWDSALAPTLRKMMENNSLRALHAWIRHQDAHCALVDMPTAPDTAFFNINTPQDWMLAQTLYTQDNKS